MEKMGWLPEPRYSQYGVKKDFYGKAVCTKTNCKLRVLYCTDLDGSRITMVDLYDNFVCHDHWMVAQAKGRQIEKENRQMMALAYCGGNEKDAELLEKVVYEFFEH